MDNHLYPYGGIRSIQIMYNGRDDPNEHNLSH